MAIGASASMGTWEVEVSELDGTTETAEVEASALGTAGATTGASAMT